MPASTARLRVVRHHDHGVLLEERLRAAGHVHDPLERAVGLGDRAHLAVRPDLVGVGVVVGQREEQEVEQVVLHQVRADAPRVAIALAGHAERRGAARVARVEQVGVEELARAVDGVPELRGLGDPAVDARARRVVAGAAAVDQIGGAGGAEAGVVEMLEDGLVRARQVRQVHVVDRVVERADDPEGARGGQRRAVLHVALLAAMEPVHRRDVVLARAVAGRDRGRGDRGHRREGRHAVADVGAALEQRRERGRLALRDRLVEHVRLQRVDDGEDELLRHYRRILRPAYFWPSRRRPPASSRTNAGIARCASGGTKIAIAGEHERRAVGVRRQERRLLRLEARADALDEAADRQPAQRRAERRRQTSPIQTSPRRPRARPRTGARRGRGRRPARSRPGRVPRGRPGRRAGRRALDEERDHGQHHDRREKGRGLEEREIRAVEVDADVAARERAGEQRREVRADAGGRREAGAGPDVEEEAHGRAVGVGTLRAR